MSLSAWSWSFLAAAYSSRVVPLRNQSVSRRMANSNAVASVVSTDISRAWTYSVRIVAVAPIDSR